MSCRSSVERQEVSMIFDLIEAIRIMWALIEFWVV